jgi:hypothetical protein
MRHRVRGGPGRGISPFELASGLLVSSESFVRTPDCGTYLPVDPVAGAAALNSYGLKGSRR